MFSPSRTTQTPSLQDITITRREIKKKKEGEMKRYAKDKLTTEKTRLN